MHKVVQSWMYNHLYTCHDSRIQ